MSCIDVLEVNGLSVNWVSNHIYWTDGRKRSVEVADFNGTNRRILITERLSQPRGIYADHVKGFAAIVKAQYTPPTLTRRNCFVASRRRRRRTEFATSSRRLPTDSAM